MSDTRAMFDKSAQSPHEGGDDFWLRAKDRWLGDTFGEASRPQIQPDTVTSKPAPQQPQKLQVKA